ncbi:hypothetical protein L6R52_40400 [Myxococcota bacterium]|nr:hypothetical protein [Myxococcota bacterium]
MSDKLIWCCIICGTRAEDKPPRRCPKCGAPAARWRLVTRPTTKSTDGVRA